MALLVTKLQSIGRGIFLHDERGVEELTLYCTKPLDDDDASATVSPSSISSVESSRLEDDVDFDKSLLGNEKNLLPIQKEILGVREIIKALSDEERNEVPDKGMFIRHFRAEKVGFKRESDTVSCLCRRCDLCGTSS